MLICEPFALLLQCISSPLPVPSSIMRCELRSRGDKIRCDHHASCGLSISREAGSITDHGSLHQICQRIRASAPPLFLPPSTPCKLFAPLHSSQPKLPLIKIWKCCARALNVSGNGVLDHKELFVLFALNFGILRFPRLACPFDI